MNEAEVANVILINKAALLGALAVGWYLRWYAGKCRCEKCAFHQNEQRIERLREKDERHERSHRDWDSCGDKSCPREKERWKQQQEKLDK